MTVKISGTFPKDMLAFNGLGEHRDIIVETEMGGEEWTGYAVCRLSVKQVARMGGTGEYVPTVQIVHIEVMEGARVEPARRALLDTFKERATDGVVEPAQGAPSLTEIADFLDPNGTLRNQSGSANEDTAHGDGTDAQSATGHAAGPVRHRSFDPYDNPDESPERHTRRPVERVELPES